MSRGDVSISCFARFLKSKNSLGSLIGIIDNSSPKGLSAISIHDQVGSFADPFSTSQIETGEGFEGPSRFSGAARASDHNLESKECFESSLEFARQAGDRATERRATFYLGVVCSSRGDHRQAIEFYKKSLDMAKEAGAQAEIKRAQQHLGNSYFVLGKAKLVWPVQSEENV